MKGIAHIIMYFLVFAGIQIVVSSAVAAVMGIDFATGTANTEMSTDMVIIASALSNFVTIALFLAAQWQKLSLEFFKPRNIMVAVACILLSLGTLLPSSWLEEQLPEFMQKDLLQEQFKMIMSTSYGYIAICLFAPIAEEVVFRGAIQNAATVLFSPSEAADNGNILRKIPTHWYAITLTAFLFALIHLNPAQMPHAFIIGLLLGWLKYKSGSIIPGIIVHWTNNSVAYLLAYFYPRSLDMSIEDFFAHETWRMAAAIFLSVMIFVTAIIQIKTLLKAPPSPPLQGGR